MFGKITKQHVVNSFHKAKGFIGHAYNQTKGFLNNVDHGFRAAKQIDHAVAPLVDKYAQNHSDNIHTTINKGIGGYENIRPKIQEGDNDIQNVKQKLKIK